MEGNGGKKESERERAELQQGALGLLSLDNISRANFAEFKTTKFEIAERPPRPPDFNVGFGGAQDRRRWDKSLASSAPARVLPSTLKFGGRGAARRPLNHTTVARPHNTSRYSSRKILSPYSLRSAACPIEHVTIAFWAMAWHNHGSPLASRLVSSVTPHGQGRRAEKSKAGTLPWA